MTFYIIKHPLLQHKLNLMREFGITMKIFRELSEECSKILIYEAMKNTPIKYKNIINWQKKKIKIATIDSKKISILIIFRAGIGMLQGAIDLLPNASISSFGARREEKMLQSFLYYKKIINSPKKSTILILDPMLATGSSIILAMKFLKDIKYKKIKIISFFSTKYGIKRLLDNFPKIEIYTGSIEKKMNKKGFIIPGIGDAGDKYFNNKS